MGCYGRRVGAWYRRARPGYQYVSTVLDTARATADAARVQHRCISERWIVAARRGD